MLKYASVHLQSEMKLFGGVDTVALKQHFGKKITELEDEKRTVKVEMTLRSVQVITIVLVQSQLLIYASDLLIVNAAREGPPVS